MLVAQWRHGGRNSLITASQEGVKLDRSTRRPSFPGHRVQKTNSAGTVLTVGGRCGTATHLCNVSHRGLWGRSMPEPPGVVRGRSGLASPGPCSPGHRVRPDHHSFCISRYPRTTYFACPDIESISSVWTGASSRFRDSRTLQRPLPLSQFNSRAVPLTTHAIPARTAGNKYTAQPPCRVVPAGSSAWTVNDRKDLRLSDLSARSFGMPDALLALNETSRAASPGPPSIPPIPPP